MKKVKSFGTGEERLLGLQQIISQYYIGNK